jgi:hypothetical protein
MTYRASGLVTLRAYEQSVVAYLEGKAAFLCISYFVVCLFFFFLSCRLLLLQLPLEEKAGSTSFHFVFGNVLELLLRQDKILQLYKSGLLCAFMSYVCSVTN